MIKYLKDQKKKEDENVKTKQEIQLLAFDAKIEDLKNKYTLYFSGEIKLPPEKEREELQKAIHSLSQTESRSPRVNMLLQNIISKFNLYNNLWLKKMNEVESGIQQLYRKPTSNFKIANAMSKIQENSIEVNLNDERSFEALILKYSELTEKKAQSEEEKEKIVNTIKSKMILNNLIIGKVDLKLSKGKIKLKLRNTDEKE